MATNTFYLRPSADISVGHTLYPEGSSSAYLLINEEVADDASTYIIANGDALFVEDFTSSFQMSGEVPASLSQLSTLNIVIRAFDPEESMKGDNLTDTHYVTLSINGTALSEKTVASNVATSWTTYSVEDADAVIAINNYIAQNGSFPSITLTYRTNAEGTDSGYTSDYQPVHITQIYLECTYEAASPTLYTKSNGTWKAAVQFYQKINGTWTEITEDECKALLQGHIVVKA